MKSKGSVQEKVKDYNDANREVAILCNHKRTVGAAHDTQMEKMTDRVSNRLSPKSAPLEHNLIDDPDQWSPVPEVADQADDDRDRSPDQEAKGCRVLPTGPGHLVGLGTPTSDLPGRGAAAEDREEVPEGERKAGGGRPEGIEGTGA